MEDENTNNISQRNYDFVAKGIRNQKTGLYAFFFSCLSILCLIVFKAFRENEVIPIMMAVVLFLILVFTSVREAFEIEGQEKELRGYKEKYIDNK